MEHQTAAVMDNRTAAVMTEVKGVVVVDLMVENSDFLLSGEMASLKDKH